MKYTICLITIILCLLPITLFADMGAIIPLESVDVDEPAQRAIIAYDGFEEILILQTELKSSNSTKLLRFIPLPSNPVVTSVSKDIFLNLKRVVEKHNLQYVMQTKSFLQSTEKINIVLRKTIGAHNITIVKVIDAREFIKWVKKFFNSMGYNYNNIKSQSYTDIINHYIKNNINYFVFDFVELNKTNFIQPIMYSFKSNRLYYPLVATNILRSYGIVELFLFTEIGIPYISTVYGFMPSTTAVVTSREMSSISPEIAKLLGEHAIIQAFKYKGKLYFNKDINEDSKITTIKPRVNHLMLRNNNEN